MKHELDKTEIANIQHALKTEIARLGRAIQKETNPAVLDARNKELNQLRALHDRLGSNTGTL